MSKLDDIREHYSSGESLDREEQYYLLDIINTLVAYNLAQMLPPDSVCDTCQYQQPGVSMMNCDQPVEDCEKPFEFFIEDSLATWYSQVSSTEEVEEEQEPPYEGMHL